MISLLLFTSCGKKVEKNDPVIGERVDRGINPADNEQVQEFIRKQTVQCSVGLLCNKSVAKVVVIDRKAVRYCTGTMIGSKKMLIAASCLTRSLRVPGIDCRQSVFAIFPEVLGHKKLVANCSKVVSSSSQFLKIPVLQLIGVARSSTITLKSKVWSSLYTDLTSPLIKDFIMKHLKE